MRIAVIDLGSNSARMSVWDVDGGKAEIILNKREYVRLSEGLSCDNLLKEEPMRRALKALSDFKAKADSLKVTSLRAVATEAVRRASNADEFIARVKSDCGIDLEILSGESESKYDFYASLPLIGDNSAVIMDVGGGSIELIRCENGSSLSHACLPLGAVVTTDRLGKDLNRLNEFFLKEFSALPMLSGIKKADIVALGGSARAFFSLYSANQEGAFVTADDFRAKAESLCSLTLSELSKIPSLNERADIIAAGLSPFYALSVILKSEKIILNNRGVREGILIECMKMK